MNYRDLQNISNLSQEILIEGANEEHNVLNRWPYTSPYLQESTEVEEGYKDLGDKARDKGHQLLNKSKKTATRGNMYAGTLPSNTPEGENLKQRASQQFAVSAFHNPEKAQAKSAANKARGEGKKKAFGNRLTRSDKQGIKDSYDLYDIILSHLLDEGYAETQEQAEVIMVNMSEDWRESIVEAEVLAQKGGVPGSVQVNKTREGGFLGIGSKEVSKPVSGSFKAKDVSSKDAARYNTGIDKKFGSADNIDNTSAANVQYAANRAGNSGYMKVKDPGSLPNTGIPNRPTPGRASDQNQARQMSGDIVRMNRR